jgi:hypothetical protein
MCAGRWIDRITTTPATAMEEFHESDVLWSDHHNHHHDCCNGHQKQLKGREPRRRVHASVCRGDLRHHPASSAPVAIPVAAKCDCCKDDAGGDEATSFVPPHVVVARRWCSAERTACPMCEGQGRTLKGRDLRSVRAAVLRMTGFLES